MKSANTCGALFIKRIVQDLDYSTKGTDEQSRFNRFGPREGSRSVEYLYDLQNTQVGTACECTFLWETLATSLVTAEYMVPNGPLIPSAYKVAVLLRYVPPSSSTSAPGGQNLIVHINCVLPDGKFRRWPNFSRLRLPRRRQIGLTSILYTKLTLEESLNSHQHR